MSTTVPTPAATKARTLADLPLRAAQQHQGVAITCEARGVRIPYAELGREVRRIARGLIALGVAPGDRVGILSSTRPEWTLADFGALCAGAVVTPVYHTNSPRECAHVLSHSGARLVFCEDAQQYEKIAAIRGDCPQLEHAVVFDPFEKGPLSLAGLRERGEEVEEAAVDARVGALGPDDLATIIYTSGTTGPPKGCMISHGNFVAAMELYEAQVELHEGTAYMFLPLAHVMAQIIQVIALDSGGELAFWSGDPKRILEELRTVRPTHFPSVPRVYEKVYTAAMAGIEEQSAVARALARWALAEGRRARELERRGVKLTGLNRRRLALADKIVLSKVRDLFGGRLVLGISAAAPIGREVLEFFDACGLTVREAYGMTETTAAGTLNTIERFRFGSIGPALPGTQVRIAPDGEILMAGPHIFRGYYRNEQATAETVVDGWLRSGDLGSVDEDGFVHITGRKKDLIITSSGKNISPSNIENELRETRWISEAVVFGDNRPYLVAMLTLDAEEAPKLAASLGVAADPAAMAADERVHAAIQEAVDAVNARFARIEQIKRFAILDHELTQAAGELTPTLKVKRNIVYDRYRDVFEGLYREGGDVT